MPIEDLQLVFKVAEFRSITAAAAQLDMHTATASAAVKRVKIKKGILDDSALRTLTQPSNNLQNPLADFLPLCKVTHA